MPDWEIDKLLLFLVFVIPGFISLRVYGLLFPTIHKDTSTQIIDFISYSCVNYAFLFIPIFYIEKIKLHESNLFYYYLFYLCVFLIMPILGVYLWKKLRESEWLQNYFPHPTQKPWDFVFSQRKSFYIKVTLTNGKIVGGIYRENSFSSNAPHPEEIYLEESWSIDSEDNLHEKKTDTEGILIMQNQISYLEFKTIEFE